MFHFYNPMPHFPQMYALYATNLTVFEYKPLLPVICNIHMNMRHRNKSFFTHSTSTFKQEVCCFVVYLTYSSSSVSAQIAVNHKSAQITAAEDQVEQKQTLENTGSET